MASDRQEQLAGPIVANPLEGRRVKVVVGTRASLRRAMGSPEEDGEEGDQREQRGGSMDRLAAGGLGGSGARDRRPSWIS